MQKHHYTFLGGTGLGGGAVTIISLTTALNKVAEECGKLLDALS